LEEVIPYYYWHAGRGTFFELYDLVAVFRQRFDSLVTEAHDNKKKSVIALMNPNVELHEIYAFAEHILKWFLSVAFVHGAIPTKQAKDTYIAFNGVSYARWNVHVRMLMPGITVIPKFGKMSDDLEIITVPFYRYETVDLELLPKTASIGSLFVGGKFWYERKFKRKGKAILHLLDLRNMQHAFFDYSNSIYVETTRQLSSIAEIMYQNISYRRVGSHCTYCPFRLACAEGESKYVTEEGFTEKVRSIKADTDAEKISKEEAEEILRQIGAI